MARKVKHVSIESRTARDKLQPRAKPYFVALAAKMHLGYRRRGKGKGAQGNWLVRQYLGRDSKGVGRYREEFIGLADDHLDADGSEIFNYDQAYELAMKRRADANKPDGPLTVKAALDLYFEYLKHQGQQHEHAAARAAFHIVPTLGTTLVDKLDAKTLRTWLFDVSKSAVKGRGRKNVLPQDDEAIRRRRSTANRVLTILKAALNHAFNEGLVNSNNEWRKVKPFENVDAARSRILTVAEAQRLINASDPAFRKLIQAALSTGARYAELTRLKVVDFNADSGTLAIWQSKSGKSRDVYLTEEGISFFKQLTAGRSGGELMLRKDDGGAWGVGHQTRPMAEAVERAKISPRITFHGLRHSYASLAIMSHTPLLVVAENLGHSDTRMVEKHYGHLTKTFRKTEIQKGAPQFGFSADNTVVTLSKGRKTGG
jgi:integrase